MTNGEVALLCKWSLERSRDRRARKAAGIRSLSPRVGGDPYPPSGRRLPIFAFVGIVVGFVLMLASSANAMSMAVADEHVFVEERYSSRAEGCDLAHGIGATTVRVNAWPGRERAIGETIRALTKCGLRTQVTLMGKPCWIAPPTTPTPRWARWAARRAKEWKSVKRFSVWNEPNHPCFLRSHNPRTYARGFRRTYTAIKRVRPDAQVLFGELAPMVNTDAWVAKAVAAKPGRADGFAHHPYEIPGQPRDDAYSISRLDLLKKVLRVYARAGFSTPRGKPLPLYLTEFGYGHHSNQAELLSDAKDMAEKAGARQFTVYQLIEPQGNGWNTSIVKANGCPFPSYLALAKPAHAAALNRREVCQPPRIQPSQAEAMFEKEGYG